MASCTDAVCQRRQSLVFKRDAQLRVIGVFPVWAAILLFPIVGRCRNHLRALSLNQSWSKTKNCHWHFDAIYHSSGDTSTSGLGSHITISGCQSLLQSLSLNSSWSNPRFALGNEHICCSTKTHGGIFTPSETRVPKNRSAIRRLIIIDNHQISM